MSVIKTLKVDGFVLTPKGEPYMEPIQDSRGALKLEQLDENGVNIWRLAHQIQKTDTPIYENKKLGDIITFALDKIDEKQSGTEIRKRFFLSCKVEEALQNGGILKITNEDIKCIEGTLENIKNPLFNYRIQEALDKAEVYNDKA